jgi:hypothetical protein
VTPKQTERARNKIAEVKRILAAEKRKFGGYDDSRGLRYVSTKYFIQLGDYSGGLKYLKWFDKNFPDDSGFPAFLFEWTIILFKTGNTNEAEQKAFQTFCSNPYWIDSFLGRPRTRIDMWHHSNLTEPEYTKILAYSSTQPDFADFALWLDELIATEDFKSRSKRYIDIQKRLLTESDRETRHYLVRQASQLERGL